MTIVIIVCGAVVTGGAMVEVGPERFTDWSSNQATFYGLLVHPYVLKIGGAEGERPMEGAGLGDELFEDSTRHFVFIEGSFGMPLNAEHPVSGGGTFDGLDDGVLGRAGNDAKSVPGDGDGLVMAGVDDDGCVAGEGGEGGAGFYLGRMLDDLGARSAGSSRVLDGGLDVLDESSVAPYVEGLGSVADGEDGLAHVVRVLKKELVDVVARGVRGGGAGIAVLVVLLGIDVGGRAGEENAVAVFCELGGFDVGEMEVDEDGHASGSSDGVEIVGQGAGGVLRVRVGNGDGDARLHGEDDNAAAYTGTERGRKD